jgi:hypothetical protein
MMHFSIHHLCEMIREFSPIQAVCGKAARTVLCGGRAMKRASLPLRLLFATFTSISPSARSRPGGGWHRAA